MAEQEQKKKQNKTLLEEVQEQQKKQGGLKVELVLEREVAEAPDIQDVIKRAAEAQKKAQVAKEKKLLVHHCTECGHAGIQLYYTGSGHFEAARDADTGEIVDLDGKPFTDSAKVKTIERIKRYGRVEAHS